MDILVLRLKDAAAVDRKFRALRPVNKRCTIEIGGGLNRPPLEQSAAIVQLFRKAQKMAREMGAELKESVSSGGSDGAVGQAKVAGL